MIVFFQVRSQRHMMRTASEARAASQANASQASASQASRAGAAKAGAAQGADDAEAG